MNALPMQVIAASFSLSAFAVSILAGLVASNEASTVLGRAILAMVICYPIGWIGGHICQRAVERQLREDDPQTTSKEAANARAEAAAPSGIEDDEEVIVV